MSHVTVSSKYQVVIPLEIRKKLNIHRGQKLTVVALGDVIELVPERDIRELKGAFPGLTTDDIREEEDRF